jgi:DNA-binding CsgD family transcriptional regulator
MRSGLGPGDLVQVRATLTALLTPLDDASAAAWQRRVGHAVQQLIGADGCGVFLGVPGESIGVGVGQWVGLQPMVDTWTERWSRRNPLDVRRRQLDARVWTRYGLLPRTVVSRSVYFNEWCRPCRNLDSAGISAPVPGEDYAEGVLFVTAASANRFAEGEREELLLGLLQPAFAAGIAMLTLARSWRDALGSALDMAGAPLAIVRPDGQLLHATSALLALVAAHPAGATLLTAAQDLARDVGRLLGKKAAAPLPVPVRAVPAPNGRYELRATLVHAPRSGPGPVVLVSVSSPVADDPTVPALRARFGLTAREAEVTLMLAHGERDRVIAYALGISHHTARRHVERALGKLGVHTRAAVAGRIRG